MKPRSRSLLERIARSQARLDRAEREGGGNAWVAVARVGTLGWLIVLPIVGGALLGHLIDVRFESGVTWALALMLLGVITGLYSLWRVTSEARATDIPPPVPRPDSPDPEAPDRDGRGPPGDDEP